MSILGKLRKIQNDLKVTDEKAWDRSLWNLRPIGSQSLSGEIVTEETALTYSAFWNAVNLISGTIGSLPLHLMQRKGRTKNIADNQRVYKVMHDRWNPFMTAKTGRQVISAHVLTWGNGYAEKVLNGYGEVIELWPISPDRVVSFNMVDNDLIYGIRVGNETIYLPKNRILHLHGLGFDGFTGYSVVAMARKSLGLAMAMETFGSLYFSNGTHPSAVITHPTKVDDIKAMREALNEVYSGLGNAQRLMLLEDGMKIDQVGIPPEDAQFLESRQFQIPEVARWFNLPPHKLKDLSKSSFNNIEQEQISFVTDSILPWLIDFEQEYNLQLLTEGQKYSEKLYFIHVVEGLLRADAKSRAEFYQIMKRNGIMTPNEIREKEDLNPFDNLLADELWTEQNMAPMGQWDKLQANKTLQPEQKAIENTNKLLKLTDIKER